MATNFVQDGKVIDFTAAGTITSGQVVPLQHAVGIALGDAVSGETVAVAIEGVFTVPKVSAAVIAAGESLTWDVSANASAGAFDDNLATPATGDVTGAAAVAFQSAGNGATTLDVMFTGVPGTVT